MIMDLLERRATSNAEVRVFISSFDPATGKQTNTNTWQSVGKCIFSESGAGKGLSADSMRESVQAVAFFKPNVVISGDRMRINGVQEYGIISVEDVTVQGQVIKVSLGKMA